jgi:hypothetical protein
LIDGVRAFRLRLSLEHWYGELIDTNILCDWVRQNRQRGRLITALFISPGTPFRKRARALICEFRDDDDILQIFGGQFFHGGSLARFQIARKISFSRLKYCCGTRIHGLPPGLVV